MKLAEILKDVPSGTKICFVGGYLLKSWETTSIHGKEEFIAPNLFQVKKDGTMSKRAFYPQLTDISFEVLTD